MSLLLLLLLLRYLGLCREARVPKKDARHLNENLKIRKHSSFTDGFVPKRNGLGRVCTEEKSVG